MIGFGGKGGGTMRWGWGGPAYVPLLHQKVLFSGVKQLTLFSSSLTPPHAQNLTSREPNITGSRDGVSNPVDTVIMLG